MRRKGGRPGETGGHDAEAVEQVLDELYATPPPAFVSRREESAAAARTDGRKEDARRIHAARRPTLAAWAANLLTRARPEETRRFLELGQALREAHRSLDAAGLRELSAQRRRVVTALSAQAAQLADEAGHRLSQAAQREVESTLRAVLADPDAAGQWAGGRLEVSLTPPSVFPSDAAPAPARTEREPASRPAPHRAASGTRAKDELAERRRKRREELARAEREAADAGRHLRDARAEQADAEESLRGADVELARLRESVAAAEERLRAAREELGRAEGDRREAEERDRAAAHAVAEAEREARASARRVERLAGRGR
ncbi:hypothetical protein EV562_101304 [Streptomyces sp. BK208]|uniref:hypothetical protein n=1 Tax=Streptomyces sp. BK208 TaxID=2512150 RepID=UPI00105EC5A3|nr:hypothetical protein [Streptomyces sp. BK208]TDT42335.1 hypothetical protein EV562_101304 [Streptomyces sp. BK208]